MALGSILSALGTGGGSSLGTLFVRLTADSVGLVKGMDAAETSVTKSSAVIARQLGAMSVAVTAALTAVGVVAVKTFMEFESSFAGVRKTINATELEFSKLKQSVRDLSKTLPISTTEINRVMEAAGQLGVEKKSLLGFTKTMIDMGVATNMTADEAAIAMARLANITRMPQEQFGKLGATIVALGANSAATEKEILDMGLRIAGAGTQVGLTIPQILALSTSLSSVGIQAELGGTAISQTMIRMDKAVALGGKQLELFAKTSGMTSDQFSKAWKDNAGQAILSFMKGLQNLDAAGENTFLLLEELEIDGSRMIDMLSRAAGAADMFAKDLTLANKAHEEGIALTAEAEKRYTTLASQLTITWNGIKLLFLAIGEQLAPAVRILNDLLKQTVNEGNDLNSTFQKFVDNVGPAFIAILGTIGDVFHYFNMGLKAGEALILGLMTLAFDQIKRQLGILLPFIEGHINNIIDLINLFLLTLKLTGKSIAGMPDRINFKFHVDMTELDDLGKGIKEAFAESKEELRQMNLDENLPSNKLLKLYDKALAPKTPGAPASLIPLTPWEENLKEMRAFWAEDSKQMQAHQIEAGKVVQANDLMLKSMIGEHQSNFGDATPWGSELEQLREVVKLNERLAVIKMSMSGDPMGRGLGRGLREFEDPLTNQFQTVANEIMLAESHLKVLQDASAKEIELLGMTHEQKLAMMEAYNERVKKLQEAQLHLVLNTSQQIFGDLTSIAETFAGKQSGIYKAMFAVSKAFAIADATVKISQGIASAFATGATIYEKLAAVAMITSATANIVSNIQAVKLTFAGEREMGGPVQAGRMYMVGEDGPEPFIPSQNGTIISNDDWTHSRNKGGDVIINNYTDGRATVRKEGNNTIVDIVRQVKDQLGSEIRDGTGSVTKALEGTFNLKRGNR